MDTLSELLRQLKGATSSVERNALAIIATETGDAAVQEVLIDLIDRPGLVNERGTLLHCVGRFECSKLFLWLVDLVCKGNWEVSHEAEQILENIELVDTDAAHQGYDLLIRARDAGIREEWRFDLIMKLISLFD